LIPQEAKLLNIANFTDEVRTGKPQDYYPAQAVAQNIVLDDKGRLKIPSKDLTAIEALEAAEQFALANLLRDKYISHPAKNRSFHYLPYKTDSNFEQTFLDEVLEKLTEKDGLLLIDKLGLEVYYNGDRALTEFKIRCYKQNGGKWHYIGMYTPDFLIIKRKDGEIYKAVIVETKGKIYANDPTFKDKREFTQTHFTAQNNKAFGYERFDYLYLEDTLPEKERIKKTHRAIQTFFEEDAVHA
jgi:hypothetical protein